jgi:hypothetical protein
MNIDQIMRAAPVIPVLVLDGEGDWAALAETFVAAGLPVLEITLRTPQALDGIRQMSQVPGAIVGAGTVLNEAQLARAIDAGSRFIVSPGLTNPLALAARDTGIAYLPGVATAGDIMRGSISGSTGSNSFRPKPRGGCRRSRLWRGRSSMFASARPAGSAPTTPPTGSRSKRCCASAERGFTAALRTISTKCRSGPAPPRASRAEPSLYFALTMFP